MSKKVSDDISKKHPLETVSWFSKLNNFWTFKEMAKTSKNGTYKQEDHFNLPAVDKIPLNRDLIFSTWKHKKSLLSTVLSLFWGRILWLTILFTLFQTLQQSSGLTLGLIVAQISDQEYTTEREKYILAFKCGYLVMANLLAAMLYNYSSFYAKRLGLRMSSSISLILFEKVSKCNIINKSEHSQGNILNYIQIDCDRFFQNLPKFLELYSCFIQLAIGMGILYYYITWPTFMILGVTVFGILLMIFFYNFRITIMDNLMEAKDNRVATLTNVINNIKFVKMKGWENYFQYKVSVRRDVEVRGLFKIACFNGVELFSMWFSQGLCTFTLIVSLILFAPSKISLPAISACMNVLFINFEAIILIPWYGSSVIDFSISLGRINKFLAFDEITNAHIKHDPEITKDYGVLVKNGNFHWSNYKGANDDEELNDDGEMVKKKKTPVDNSSLAETLMDTSISDRDDKGFRLHNINFRAKKGELVFIIGKIGCGKSSLLYSLLGEMPKTEEAGDFTIYRSKNAAMLSQHPWLLGSTIKANILLDKPFDQQLFDKALRLSQLADDVKEMPDGVETFIGENGSTVSGGQRTRIGLARCIYQDPDLLILDDPLSALDLKVADKIMKEGLNGELKGKTRIIATHAIHNLKYADYIYVLDHGKIVFEGTYEDINDSPIYKEFKEVTEHFTAENEEEEIEIEDLEIASPRIEESRMRKTTFKVKRKESGFQDEFFNKVMGKHIDPTVKSNERLQTEQINLEDVNQDEFLNQLFLEEDKETGKMSWHTVKAFLGEIGGPFPLLMILVACLCMMGISFLADLTTLEWAKNFDPFEKFDYVWFIGFLLFSRAFLTVIRSMFVFGTQLVMSRQLHARMLFRVLHAQIGNFLERVPAGRIINRFTKDIEVIDKEIGWTISGVIMEGSGTCISIGILTWTVGPFLSGAIFIFIITGVILQRKLMNTKREIVRLEAVSRSPILTCVTGLLKGAPEIRVLEKQEFVRLEYIDKLHEMQKNNLLISGLDHWYMNQINMINILLIQLPGFIIIYYTIVILGANFPIEKLVIFVLKSIEVSYSLMNLLMNFSMLESQFVAVERCSKFSQIEPEAHYLNFKIHEKKYLHPNQRETIVHIMKELAKNEKAVIKRGRVSLQKVTAKYPTKPKPVLNELSLEINPGEKIGIVGRTGAGKTSLIKLFWMCLEPSEGRILFDGKDVSKIDLKVLRSNLDIISQETAIFEGSLRENLDPKLEYLMDKNSEAFKKRDRELLKKLYDIGFKEEHLDGKGLDFQITANGDNLSLGQKQLLCFMRVLIDPKKLMILDEATANIDLKTERLMQLAVKQEFKESTMFIIAHRIQTVLDCDKICLLEYGKIAEFGTPKELIRRPGSKFGEIYKKLKENVGATAEELS